MFRTRNTDESRELSVPRIVAPFMEARRVDYTQGFRRLLLYHYSGIGVFCMQIISEYVCGMDVHKKSITACVLTPKKKVIQTFGTMTDDLLKLVDWIKSFHCTHVAMESTGVYWKPIYNLLELEDGLEVFVVNAQHMKQVPGRKTDVKDSEWIADLLKHGLLKPSYIPNREQRELRELVRYRRSLIDERAREANRIQKVLEGANIKLGSVASNVLGVSGRTIIKEIINGENNPAILANYALKTLRKKKDM
jgi:hypothetical protein